MREAISYLSYLIQKAKVYFSNKAVTEEYPFVKKEYPPESRLKLKNKYNECSVCLKCEKLCPTDAIKIVSDTIDSAEVSPVTVHGFKVERDLRSFIVDYSKCIFCSECTMNCPTGSLRFLREAMDPKVYIRELSQEKVPKARKFKTGGSIADKFN